MECILNPKHFTFLLSDVYANESTSPSSLIVPNKKLHLPNKQVHFPKVAGFDLKKLHIPPKGLIAIDPGRNNIGGAVSSDWNMTAGAWLAWPNTEAGIAKMINDINFYVEKGNVGGLVFGCMGKDYLSDPSKKKGDLQNLLQKLKKHGGLSDTLIYTFQDETNSTQMAIEIIGPKPRYMSKKLQQAYKDDLDKYSAKCTLDMHMEDNWLFVQGFRAYLADVLHVP